MYIMTTRYKRKHSKYCSFVPNDCLTKYEQRLYKDLRMRLYPSRDNVWQVEDNQCNRFECLKYHEHRVPCSHMIAVIKAQGLRVKDFFDESYLIESYCAMYSKPLYPLSICSLISLLDTTVPAFRVQKGRPKEKRYRKEVWRSKKRRCGKCMEL